MSSTTAELTANSTTAASSNPAPTASKSSSTDAPSYTSDVSPPSYSEAAPTYNLAEPSTSTPSSSAPTSTTVATANDTNPAAAAPDADNEGEDDSDDDDDDGQDLPATPIPFHFLIQQPTSTTSDASTSTTTTSSSSSSSSSSSPPQKITHIHPVPDVLLSTTAPPADAQDLFVTVLHDVLGAHQAECRDAAPDVCDVCAAAKESVLLTPVSFLHVDEDVPPSYTSSNNNNNNNNNNANAGGERAAALGKRVEVLVTPVCGREECAQMARARLRRAMEDTHDDDDDHEHEERAAVGPEDPRCRVCGGTRETKRCAGCGVVRYCGRECQRRDWREGGHKRVCAAWAALVEEGRMEEARARAVGSGQEA